MVKFHCLQKPTRLTDGLLSLSLFKLTMTMIEILLANEDRKAEESQAKHDIKENGSGIPSPPKPENAPVVAPLTIDDMLSLDTSLIRKAGEDDVSMIVDVDDTQSELDNDLDASVASGSTDGKSAPVKESSGVSTKSDEKSKSSRGDSKKESKDGSHVAGKEAGEKEGDSKPTSKGKQRFVTNDIRCE